MSVVGNELILSNGKIIKIYTMNNLIQIPRKLSVLWSAFKTPIKITEQLCTDNSYSLPSNNFASFTGNIDTLSGFVFFKRTPPIQLDSPVVNEGIALDIYFNGRGRRPGIEFKYEGSSDITEIRVYCWVPTTDGYITLITDYFGSITRYFNNKGTIRIPVPDGGLLYFKIYSNNSSTTSIFNIQCKCIKPFPPPCCIEENTCLSIYGERIPLTNNVEVTNSLYNIVPCAQWKAIADLILSTFIVTRLPIPLTPIGLVPDTYKIVSDGRNLLNGNPNDPLEMYNTSSGNWWSQYGLTTNTTFVTVFLNGNPLNPTDVPPYWSTYELGVGEILWSITPVAVLNEPDFPLVRIGQIPVATVTIDLFIDSFVHPTPSMLYITQMGGDNYEQISLLDPGIWLGGSHYQIKDKTINSVNDVAIELIPNLDVISNASFTMTLTYEASMSKS